VDRRQVLRRLDAAWGAFTASYAGLSDAQLMKPGVTLIDFVQTAPEDQLSRENRFRRRLRLDAYGHDPLHAEAIRQWRRKIPA
jgi:hypothetical protein